MRMSCAILVICVHVYPLTMFGEQANFVLVHAVARIAVPFFCVTSGFFFFQKIEIRPKTPQAKKENRPEMCLSDRVYADRPLLP